MDISGDGSNLDVYYSLKTGTWTGEDHTGDSNGPGHASGEEDGSTDTDEDDCEIWFNIIDNGDTDGDGLKYYQEVFVLMTDPATWDSDGDGYADGKDFEPLDNTVDGMITITTFDLSDTFLDEEDALGDWYGGYAQQDASVDLSTNIIEIYSQTMSYPVDDLVGDLPGPISRSWAKAWIGKTTSILSDAMLTISFQVDIYGHNTIDTGLTYFEIWLEVYDSGGGIVSKEKLYENPDNPYVWDWTNTIFTSSQPLFVPSDSVIKILFYTHSLSLNAESPPPINGVYFATDYDVNPTNEYIHIDWLKISMEEWI